MTHYLRKQSRMKYRPDVRAATTTTQTMINDVELLNEK